MDQIDSQLQLQLIIDKLRWRYDVDVKQLCVLHHASSEATSADSWFLMLFLFAPLTDRNSASSGGKEKPVWLCNCKPSELNPGGQLRSITSSAVFEMQLYKRQPYGIHVASMYAPMYWVNWRAVFYVFVCSGFVSVWFFYKEYSLFTATGLPVKAQFSKSVTWHWSRGKIYLLWFLNEIWPSVTHKIIMASTALVTLAAGFCP